MKVLVTGATGQLGYDIIKELRSREIPAVGLGSKDCDITDLSAVLHTVEDIQPDAVIHCAGYTAVDKAEEETELCHMVKRNRDTESDNCLQKNRLQIYVCKLRLRIRRCGRSPLETR